MENLVDNSREGLSSQKLKDSFIKSLNGMALGLFSSLLIGLIMKQLGGVFNFELLVSFGTIAQSLMGPAIGVGVAYSLGAEPLVIFSSAIVGAIGAGSIDINTGIISVGEPVGAYIASLVGVIVSGFINKESSFKILSLPLITIFFGGLVGVYISPAISSFMNLIGALINRATELKPIPMGIIVSTVMGIMLTLPVSSAAISISLGLSGLAAGASVVGCCCNMIGFAVISYKDNGFGGFLAQGLGTSMLQITNIVKNPKIWLPAIVSSAILGPISTSLLKMENNMLGAGMGTSGLVGQIGAIDSMGMDLSTLIKIGLLHFILPGLISYLVYRLMYKKGLIKDGDMKL